MTNEKKKSIERRATGSQQIARLIHLVWLFLFHSLLFRFLFFPWVKGHSRNQTKQKRDVEKIYIFNYVLETQAKGFYLVCKLLKSSTISSPKQLIHPCCCACIRWYGWVYCYVYCTSILWNNCKHLPNLVSARPSWL